MDNTELAIYYHFRNGDEDACTLLFKHYAQRMQYMAFFLVGERELAVRLSYLAFDTLKITTEQFETVEDIGYFLYDKIASLAISSLKERGLMTTRRGIALSDDEAMSQEVAYAIIKTEFLYMKEKENEKPEIKPPLPETNASAIETHLEGDTAKTDHLAVEKSVLTYLDAYASELPPNLHEILFRRFVNEETYESIAESLQMPLQLVQFKYAKAFSTLKSLILKSDKKGQ